MNKRKLSFWEIWNMSFGFLGIQFGFALQGGFMSRIFQTLGAEIYDIPIMWIAAPLTGLLVQPIIGYLSDRTWSPRWGRRRPYFLIGAVFSSIALFFVPYSPALWVAAGFLWILDASINVSMEPFRALVADKLPDSQRSYGFVVQTLIIGIGTFVASNLPWMVSQLGVSDSAPSGVVPMSVKVAFAIGAFVFFISILYTVFTTTEYPPEDMEEFEREKKEKNSFVSDILGNIGSMPLTMKKLGLVQFFSWFAFFTMWGLTNPALTEHVFKTPNPTQELYEVADKSTESIEKIKSEFLVIAKEDSLFFSNALADTLISDSRLSEQYKVKYNSLEDNAEKYAFVQSVTKDFDNHKAWYWVSNNKFQKSSNKVGSYMGIYGLSSMAFALILVFYTSRRRINRKLVHLFSLVLGGLGFISMYFVPSPSWLILSFTLIGFSWGSILSMPYAMLSSSVDPKKMGVIMGIFNMFIVIPQVIAAVGGINFTYKLIGEDTINAMIVAGISLIIAGFCNLLITNKDAITYNPKEVTE
ncbi:MFS transporter [Aquimarina mytili]|uniref:MFS transporter n=1 Tax=Aquimarina mytili TaxID=874423 RepID=A0A936ZUW7_9FLAO|nr:MFS transporter [Aquimarina mytili]MBL0682611.1 MFS transporter [Aquimarina mytili]